MRFQSAVRSEIPNRTFLFIFSFSGFLVIQYNAMPCFLILDNNLFFYLIKTWREREMSSQKKDQVEIYNESQTIQVDHFTFNYFKLAMFKVRFNTIRK